MRGNRTSLTIVRRVAADLECLRPLRVFATRCPRDCSSVSIAARSGALIGQQDCFIAEQVCSDGARGPTFRASPARGPSQIGRGPMPKHGCPARQRGHRISTGSPGVMTSFPDDLSRWVWDQRYRWRTGNDAHDADMEATRTFARRKRQKRQDDQMGGGIPRVARRLELPRRADPCRGGHWPLSDASQLLRHGSHRGLGAGNLRRAREQP
jgi:hypothetical protein